MHGPRRPTPLRNGKPDARYPPLSLRRPMARAARQCYAIQSARDGADFATMIRKRTVLVLAILASLAIGAALPSLFSAISVRMSPDRKSQATEPEAAQGEVRLSPAQIETSKISVDAVGPGDITRQLTAPGAVKPDPDKIARVAAKVTGVVEELRKRLGDSVARGETIAIIDSREVAEAKSEYLAALANFDLQNVLFQREKGLFEKKITAEQLFLKAKAVFMEAKVKLDLARQKLAALDMSEQEIAALPSQPIADLRRKEIRAPICGTRDRASGQRRPAGRRRRSGEGTLRHLRSLGRRGRTRGARRRSWPTARGSGGSAAKRRRSRLRRQDHLRQRDDHARDALGPCPCALSPIRISRYGPAVFSKRKSHSSKRE